LGYVSRVDFACQLTGHIGRTCAQGAQSPFQLLLGYGLLAENALKQLF